MERIREALCVVLFSAVLTVVCLQSNATEKMRQTVNCEGLFECFDYEELKEYADAIVKVQVLDELTEENSYVEMSNEGYITRFCAVRQLEVKELFKNNMGIKQGEEISVQELCAIYKNESEEVLFIINEQEPLEKGKEYILFLSDGYSMSGEPAIVAGANGTVDATEISLDSEFLDIQIKSIAEYDSNLNIDKKKEILKDEFVAKGEDIVSKNTHKKIDLKAIKQEMRRKRK